MAARLTTWPNVLCSLIDGFSTLDAIEKVPIGDKHRPVTDIVISSVTIHANPIADLEA